MSPSRRRHRAAVDALSLALGLLWVSQAFAGSAAPPLPAELPGEARADLEDLAESADVATHVEAEPFLVRREIFEYLLDHPEFATHVARTLRLTSLRIWSAPDGLHLDDGWGVVGRFRVVYATNGTRLFHARGRYKTALLPAIHGEALTMFEYAASPAGAGRTLVRPALSGYLRLDSRLAGLGLRVLSGVAQRKADEKARRIMKLFARASRAIEDDPAGVWDKLNERPDVPRRELEEFGRLLNGR